MLLYSTVGLLLLFMHFINKYDFTLLNLTCHVIVMKTHLPLIYTQTVSLHHFEAMFALQVSVHFPFSAINIIAHRTFEST